MIPYTGIVHTPRDKDTKYSMKPKKKNLYQQCADLVDEFTDDDILSTYLMEFLKVCLENSRESGQPFYKNTFKGKLNSLAKLSTDNYEQRKIVKQTLDNGWAGFYEIKEERYGRRRTGNAAHDIEQLSAGLNERAKKRGADSGEQKF